MNESGAPVAVVTGGGAGIGKAIAQQLARDGATVALVSRDRAHLEPTATEIASAGGRALWYEGDIRDPDRMVEVRDELLADTGRIDVLVNNAGGQFPCLLENMSINGWRTVVDLSLNSVFYTSRIFGEPMIEARRGNIVTISALTGLRGTLGMGHVAAARGGVRNLTETLAAEWGRYNVRVNAVLPGPIETEGFRAELGSVAPEILQSAISRVPLQRYGKPSEVASVVSFLVSDAASYITGQSIGADGGAAITWSGLTPAEMTGEETRQVLQVEDYGL